MKSMIIATLAAILFAGSPASGAEEKDSRGVFRHVVCFKFKDGTPPADIAEIEEAFAALEEKIDTIIDFEWGTADNIEPMNEGFTHCFLVTFADKAGLEVYLPHPAHKEFVDLLKPKLDKVFVFDYTAQ